MSGRGRGRKRKSNEEPGSSRDRESNSTVSVNNMWDMDKPENWTVAELRQKLSDLNIRPPKGLNKCHLLQLVKENINMSSLSDNVIPVSHSATSSGPADNAMNASCVKALQDHVARLEQLILRQNNAGVGQAKDTTAHGLVTSQTPPRSNTDS